MTLLNKESGRQKYTPYWNSFTLIGVNPLQLPNGMYYSFVGLEEQPKYLGERNLPRLSGTPRAECSWYQFSVNRPPSVSRGGYISGSLGQPSTAYGKPEFYHVVMADGVEGDPSGSS